MTTAPEHPAPTPLAPGAPRSGTTFLGLPTAPRGVGHLRGDRPRRLLDAVKGLALVEVPAAEEGCGFGGTFALKNAEGSVAMGADKARSARATGAEVLRAVDDSCLTHVGGVRSRERSGMRVVHLAEILASTEGDAA